ncbi:hypothetical protein TVAG_233650 [Trichomonas vaginalis G3]|uniref:receptor protein-tyrosine kinase n=1 Tax=Trichomonas vaginalis (strain ATCC PRA-98 / G3) TaxID=412133 RepID=A2FLU5_TRIV3|nr:serine-type endopeptidase protein [Trichomonas vaginalis G3]EAX94114.1 hypothetical protein TVAG_233650 [Trichomonas vaginalis G3]KAI5512692.1 serine-type endopeptidase protein [Trichomonas vaginalis G3]|eukprot:XP_001307044.1 hypothetical protein [Trichomonas vaginalis G3]
MTDIYPYRGYSESVSLGKGTYLFECYGAEGGNNDKVLGGKGSYISGVLYNDENNKELTISVGGQGSEFVKNTANSNLGGFPDGGSSGRNNVKVNEGGSAGGGGSSSIYMDNIPIIVAAGGSGAAGNCPGAPGGNLNNAYNYSKYNVLTNVIIPSDSQCDISVKTYYSQIPPSGYGGGYPCGIKAKQSYISLSYGAVSTSGMSYIYIDKIRLVSMNDGTTP